PSSLATRHSPLATLLAVLFAMMFPTLAAWSYFLALVEQGDKPNFWQQAAYVAGKIVQFGFPLVFLGMVERRLPRLTQPRFAGLALGLGFGLIVVALMLGIYFGALRGTEMLQQTPARLQQKLHEFNMDTPARYAVLTGFIVAAHSLLEEYYWRWFVFGQLRRLTTRTPAIALSSLAFMAHHVVVLYVYLPGQFWMAVMPFSLAIAIGGAVWAWLYERSNSIWSPWLSHLLIDGGIFVIGWDLLWPI
ncbi:MAG TPA: CPBP family intramembrane glutamic endopeptidase, partial [Gemmataceae bacterium]|nr:CPBP family intramembrane glutamic endopeptidase [Gemmataceae bacterium]